MKYIGGIITSYIVLLVLDIMQRRNHKRTQSLKKFTVRTITDVSIVCAVGAIFVIGAMVFALDYSGRSAHALKRVQRTGIAVQQSSAAVQPRPLGMG